MAGVELANAWVNIIPSTKDIAPGVRKALGEVDKTAAKAGTSLGNKLSGAMSKALKAGAISAGTAVGGVLAGSIAKGFGRLSAIEGAQAKLKGLGSSAEDVAGIMDNALASVKGTANGLGEAATVSAQMVAAGIKPGQELERTLKTVGDTAAIAGRSMEDVGLIFGSIAARGKLQGDDLLQLTSAGVPVLQMLAEETGKTSTEISDMVSAGEIDFATFERAMREGVGGSALEMGNTFSGAMANMGAAMGRFGEVLVRPAFMAAPALFGSIGGAFDAMADGFRPASEQLEGILAPAFERVGKAIENAGPTLETAGQKFGELAVKVAEVAVDPDTWEFIGRIFEHLGRAASIAWGPVSALIKALMDISSQISTAVWDALINVLEALAPVLENVIVPVLEKVAGFAREHPELVGGMVTAWLGMMAINKLTSPLRGVANALLAVGKVFVLMKFADEMMGIAKATKATSPVLSSFARMAGRLAKAFNPLGRVLEFITGPMKKLGGLAVQVITKINPWVAVIAAVVGALTWFFTQTELGQEIFQNFVDIVSAGWDWMSQKAGEAVSAIGEWLSTAWETIKSLFGQAVEAVTNTFTSIWETIQPVVMAIWDAIKQIGQIAVNVFGGTLAVALGLAMVAWQGLSALFSAVWNNILKPIFTAFGDAAKWLYNEVILPVVDWIVQKWNQLSFAMGVAWQLIKTTVIDAFSTAIQWLWTTVISPVIDWIVQKWNALSTAMSVAWQLIKTTVIDAMAAAWNWLWLNVINPVITWIIDKWNQLSFAMSVAWQRIKTTVIDAFSTAFRALWDNVVNPVISWIGAKWDWMKNALHVGWLWINARVFEPFRDALQRLKSFFGTVVEGIRNTWNKLKSALAGPINFMINTVYNGGIAKAWDTIGGFLPLNPKTAKKLAPISGYATGGAIRGPGSGTSDDILARLSNGEHVLTAADVRAAGGQGAVYAMRQALKKGQGFTFDGTSLQLLPEHINNRKGDLVGAAPGLFPAFKDGGEVRPMWELQLERGHKWAKARHGRPYVLGGSAEGGGGTDCSGFMSGIADVMAGGNGARQWATMAFNGGGNSQYPSGPQGFVAGLKGHTFSIGVTNGGAAGGHTAGTLGATSRVGAVNVESGGAPSMVKYGTGAAGANDSYFRTHYHLPIGPGGAFVIGKGSGGPSPEQMKDLISKKVSDVIDKIMGPVKNRLPSGPPAWKDIPRGVYDKGKKSLSDKMADVIGGLGDKLSTVYTAAQEVGDILRNAGRGAMEWAGRAIGLHDQGGWLQSGNLALNLSGKPEPVLTNAQWNQIADLIRQIGRLAPPLEKWANAAAKHVEADPTRNVQAWLRTSSMKDQFDMLGKVPGMDSVLKPFSGLVTAQSELSSQYAEQAAKARELKAAESEMAAARESGDQERITKAEENLSKARDAASQVAAAVGHAEIAMAIEVASFVFDAIDHIVTSVMKARTEVYKALAGSMDVVVELNQMLDKQRETVAGLRIDAAMAQIELSSAFRSLRLTQMDGVKAQLESTKTLADAQAAFDAQRNSDMRRAAAQYTDLSLAYDRFRWASKVAMDSAFDDMSAWSDETHALYAELQAARIGQLLAEKNAQKANLEAAYKVTLAALDLRDVTTNLGYATQQLALMSGSSFGFNSASGLIGSKVADLMAERAELSAQQGQNWWRIFSWHASGASTAAARRAKQIDEEIARLQAMPEWEGFSKEQQATIDKALASAGWMGFMGGGDHIGTLIKNSAIGDPQRALDELKLKGDLLNLQKQQDDLRAKIERGQAEIDHRSKLDPLETEIKGLEMERGSKEAWAEYWRAENAGVRDALKALAEYQADSAKQIKAMAEQSREGQPVTLVGSSASMDDVQDMLEKLGHRVNRLERPAPSAATVAQSRR